MPPTVRPTPLVRPVPSSWKIVRLADFFMVAFADCVAVIATKPGVRVVTSPVGETVAFATSLDSQVTATGSLPTSAVNCTGVPSSTPT